MIEYKFWLNDQTKNHFYYIEIIIQERKIMSSNNTAQLPPTKRQLRACMLCSLIKTAAQFRDFGCDNCESILKLTRSTERINDCTTTQFEGYLII